MGVIKVTWLTPKQDLLQQRHHICIFLSQTGLVAKRKVHSAIEVFAQIVGTQGKVTKEVGERQYYFASVEVGALKSKVLGAV